MVTGREDKKKGEQTDRGNQHPIKHVSWIDLANISIGCFGYTFALFVIREFFGVAAFVVVLFCVSFATVLLAYIARARFCEMLIGSIGRHYEMIVHVQQIIMGHMQQDIDRLKKELEECNDGEEWKKGRSEV